MRDRSNAEEGKLQKKLEAAQKNQNLMQGTAPKVVAKVRRQWRGSLSFEKEKMDNWAAREEGEEESEGADDIEDERDEVLLSNLKLKTAGVWNDDAHAGPMKEPIQRTEEETMNEMLLERDAEGGTYQMLTARPGARAESAEAENDIMKAAAGKRRWISRQAAARDDGGDGEEAGRQGGRRRNQPCRRWRKSVREGPRVESSLPRDPAATSGRVPHGADGDDGSSKRGRHDSLVMGWEDLVGQVQRPMSGTLSCSDVVASWATSREPSLHGPAPEVVPAVELGRRRLGDGVSAAAEIGSGPGKTVRRKEKGAGSRCRLPGVAEEVQEIDADRVDGQKRLEEGRREQGRRQGQEWRREEHPGEAGEGGRRRRQLSAGRRRVFSKGDKPLKCGGMRYSNKSRIDAHLNATVGKNGVGSHSWLACFESLNDIDSGRPICRLHGCLLRARQLGAVTPRPSVRDRERSNAATLQQLLPSHLPVSPVSSERPRGCHARRNWTLRRSAWLLTEWLISVYNYHELACPKSAWQYESVLGVWEISDARVKAVSNLYEELPPFCRAQSSEGWTRGRKTLFEALQFLT